MDKKEYKQALDAALAEIQEILTKQKVLDERLTQLKNTVEVLSGLLKEEPTIGPGFWSSIVDTPEGMGITDAIRHILIRAKVPFSPTEIRDSLNKAGIDGDHENTMAVIHNTLRRLEKQGEAKEASSGWVITDKAIQRIESLKLKKKS